MPVTYARVTGTATAQGGLAVTTKVTARPLTTNELLRHPTEGLLVGRWEGLVYPDGTIHDTEDGALGLRIPLGVTPANPWWVFELEVPDQRHGTTSKWLGSAVVTQDVGINDLLQINLTAVSKDIADDIVTARDEAVTAAADAEDAKVAAQAVGTTNDTVIAGRVNDPASATSTALVAGFAVVNEAPLTPERYGAAGNDTTDDAAAIESALAAFVGALDRFGATGKKAARFELRRGKRYRVARTVTVPIGALQVTGGTIDGHGAELRLDSVSDAYALSVDPSANGYWRNFTLDGLSLLNGGLRLVTRGSVSLAFVYGWTVKDLTVDGATQHGFLCDGSFEGVLINPRVGLANTVTAYDGVHFKIGPDGTPVSSVEVYGGETRRGRHGIYADNADVNVYGFTTLDAVDYGANLRSMSGNMISGLHLERCQTGKASLAAGGAGAFVSGSAHVDAAFAYDWIDAAQRRMTYAVETFAGSASPILVTGGRVSNVPTHTFAAGASGSDVTLIGVPSYAESGSFVSGGGTLTVTGRGGRQFRGASPTTFHRNAGADIALAVRNSTETADRLAVTATGQMQWGGFNAAADVTLGREAANVLAAGAGDSIKVDGAWNSGPLRLGANYLWVDSSSRLRIKASLPNSDTDGIIVGTQLDETPQPVPLSGPGVTDYARAATRRSEELRMGITRVTTRRKAANIGESQVMGRAAVLWVVAVVQPAAYGQLFGLSEASRAVRQVAQSTLLPDVWSVTAVVAGWFVVASLLSRDPEVSRVWEIAADLLMAVASLLFSYAALAAVGWSGGAWAASTAFALAGSCTGRAWLLARQIWWVRRHGGDQ